MVIECLYHAIVCAGVIEPQVLSSAIVCDELAQCITIVIDRDRREVSAWILAESLVEE